VNALGEEAACRGGLGHERARAGLQRAEQLVVAGVHGQHDDAHRGARLAQGARRLEAAAVGQAQIHDHDVGLQRAGLAHALGGGGGLADDLELPVALERVPQALADQVMIVDEQDLGAGAGHGAGRHARVTPLLVRSR
jgi:hypothetical protein